MRHLPLHELTGRPGFTRLLLFVLVGFISAPGRALGFPVAFELPVWSAGGLLCGTEIFQGKQKPCGVCFSGRTD